MTQLPRIVPALAIVCAAGLSAPGALAQETGDRLTVWSGIYTEEQAARGADRFNESCISCHGSGTSGAPALSTSGDVFLENWGEDYLASLFDRLRTTMPARAPGSLPDSAYVDLVTFMLESNGFPAGAGELTLEMLPNIRVEGRDGPGPVPDFSLVAVVGCLRPADGRWLLERATDLVRTRNPSSSAPEALELLDLRPLGTHTYELIYIFPAPVAFAGHKLEAKGFLIRDNEPAQINVTSFASIAGSC